MPGVISFDDVLPAEAREQAGHAGNLLPCRRGSCDAASTGRAARNHCNQGNG